MKLSSLLFRVFLITSCSTICSSLLAHQVPQSNTVAQECGTPAPSKAAIEAAEKPIFRLKRNVAASIPLSVVTIPVKAHIIRQSNGTGGLSVATLNAAFTNLNIKYQPANFQFILCSSVHYIDSDALYDCDVDTENIQLILNNVNDAINIYFVNSLREDGSEISGIACFPCGILQGRIIFQGNGMLRIGQ